MPYSYYDNGVEEEEADYITYFLTVAATLVGGFYANLIANSNDVLMCGRVRKFSGGDISCKLIRLFGWCEMYINNEC